MPDVISEGTAKPICFPVLYQQSTQTQSNRTLPPSKRGRGKCTILAPPTSVPSGGCRGQHHPETLGSLPGCKVKHASWNTKQHSLLTNPSATEKLLSSLHRLLYSSFHPVSIAQRVAQLPGTSFPKLLSDVLKPRTLMLTAKNRQNYQPNQLITWHDL